MFGKGSKGGPVILALLFCLAALVLVPPPAAAGSTFRQAAGIYSASFIVGFDCADLADRLSAVEQAVRGLLPADSEWPGPEVLFEQVVRLRFPVPLDAGKVLGLIRASGLAVYCEVDEARKAYDAPNDPYYGQQWQFGAISAEGGWDVTHGSGSVTVAVIDTGIDYNHPDLSGKVLTGKNYVDGSSDPYDDNGHGTHVAGLAAAMTDNGVGVAGVDWAARILPLKVLDSSGSGYDSDIASAIRYAADSGAEVINMSLGSSTSTFTLQLAVNYAYGKGVTIVAAAGNDGTSSVSYPAAYSGVIAVGAIDSGGNRAEFSNYGSKLDLMAPGVSLPSTYTNGAYQKMSGTSMSSPIVAGAACMVLAAFPGYASKPDEVASKLTSTATDMGTPGFDTGYGYGKLNLAAALGGSEPPDPDPDPDPDPEPAPPSDDLDSVNGGSTTWYLAEGYTGPGFNTYALLENPNTQTAAVTVEMVTSLGEYDALDLYLPAHTRTTLNMNGIWPDREISTYVGSNNGVGILVERSMYFNNGSFEGGHCVAGAAAASASWYFAEGYTGHDFDEWILVLNPQPYAQSALLRVLTGSGDILEYYYELPATSRTTIHLNDLVPNQELSAHLVSDYPVVAERAMYFAYNGVSDGHASMGCAELSSVWYFAEGYTGDGFDEWLLLLNPYYSYTVNVTIEFFLNSGSSFSRTYELPPASRNTFKIDDIVGGQDVSMRVTVPSEFPILAERAMYFLYGGAWGGGHGDLGSTSTSTTWGLAEGYSGTGFDTWVLVQNLGDITSSTAFYFLNTDGTHSMFTRNIPAHSRYSLRADDVVPDREFSVVVDSANDQPLVVERSVYFGTGRYDGGTSETGHPLSH